MSVLLENEVDGESGNVSEVNLGCLLKEQERLSEQIME